jgi:hypothetical protein
MVVGEYCCQIVLDDELVIYCAPAGPVSVPSGNAVKIAVPAWLGHDVLPSMSQGSVLAAMTVAVFLQALISENVSARVAVPAQEPLFASAETMSARVTI